MNLTLPFVDCLACRTAAAVVALNAGAVQMRGVVNDGAPPGAPVS